MNQFGPVQAHSKGQNTSAQCDSSTWSDTWRTMFLFDRVEMCGAKLLPFRRLHNPLAFHSLWSDPSGHWLVAALFDDLDFHRIYACIFQPWYKVIIIRSWSSVTVASLGLYVFAWHLQERNFIKTTPEEQFTELSTSWCSTLCKVVMRTHKESVFQTAA